MQAPFLALTDLALSLTVESGVGHPRFVLGWVCATSTIFCLFHLRDYYRILLSSATGVTVVHLTILNIRYPGRISAEAVMITCLSMMTVIKSLTQVWIQFALNLAQTIELDDHPPPVRTLDPSLTDLPSQLM